MAEKKINGRTFKTEPLLATQALVLQARLFKAIGPAVSSFAALMKERSEAGAVSDSAIKAGATALASIFTQSEPEQIAGLIKDIVEVAQIKRPSGVYENCDLDGDFTGYQKDLLPVAFFVLKEQFGDFFTGLPGIGNLSKLATA